MKKKYIYIIILVLILLSLVLLYIDKTTYKEYSKNYFYMDTYINIKINSTKNKKEINNIFNDIDYLYSSYNKLTNRYEKYDGIVNVYYLNEILSNNEEIEIELDPTLDPSKNLKRLFTKGKKAKNAIEQTSIQIDITKNEISYLDTILVQLEFANSNELDEITDELIKERYLKPKKATNSKRKNTTISKYNIDDIDVYVGKNNIQNSYITHQLSSSFDWWFHVKDMPGSHVLFKSPYPGYELSEKEIRFCANLAGSFSKASHSSSVPVDYTLIKYIKKIPGLKGCEVTYTNQKTIYIDPKL